jgi:hypothetical protein
MCGPQSSGKTTRSEKMLEDNPDLLYLCSDLYYPIDTKGKRYWLDECGNKRCWYTEPLPSEVKDRAYSWAYQRLIAEMDARKDILFEGTLVDRHTRKKYLSEANKRDYEVHGMFLLPSLLVCAQRNAERKHPVPEVALARTYSKVELPTQEEGFSSLKIIRMN